jgi:hypothetical protein
LPKSTSSNVCSVIHDAAERESTTVAKTSSDYYEDGTCIKVRLVRMQDFICDGGSGKETELDMQLATCPRRETSRAARLRIVLCFAWCSTRCQHAALQFAVQVTSNVRTKTASRCTRSVRRDRRFACRSVLVTACTPVLGPACHSCTSACAHDSDRTLS